jgi:lysine 2,3-aminomutase
VGTHEFGAAQLFRFLKLTADRQRAIEEVAERFPAKIPPGYLERAAREARPDDPVVKMVLPDPREVEKGGGLMDDPLAEEVHSPLFGLVHRYRDRALLLLTTRCAVHCRFCTRRRLIGRGWRQLEPAELDRCLTYVRDHPEIREVILSGGDPLTLPDDYLASVLERLGEIGSLRVIRLGTRIPAVWPERITKSLAEVLSRHRKDPALYVLTHFNHPRELDDQAAHGLGLMADSGVPLANQTVLLSGVNDDVETLRELFCGLLASRAQPYYLHQCDLTTGLGHFRTSLEESVALMREVREGFSGLAVPTLVVDLPGGGGKVPLSFEPMVARTDSHWIIENSGGERFRYPRKKTG